MGNASVQYLQPKEAEELLGAAGKVLRGQLERTQRRTIDAGTLAQLLLTRFEDGVPDKLVSALFRAFTGDAVVAVDDFLCVLAVTRSDDRDARRKLLCRVYEQPAGYLQRQRVEGLLVLAYGEGHRSRVRLFLDQLYGHQSQTQTQSMSWRDVELFRGSLELLGAWVFRLLDSLLEPLPPRLLALERAVSSLEAPQPGLDAPASAALRRLFAAYCSTSGGGSSSRPEMSQSLWERWTRHWLTPPLAALLFATQLLLHQHAQQQTQSSQSAGLRTTWRFADFAGFCALYSGGAPSRQLSALVSTVLQATAPSRHKAAIRGLMRLLLAETDSTGHNTTTSKNSNNSKGHTSISRQGSSAASPEEPTILRSFSRQQQDSADSAPVTPIARIGRLLLHSDDSSSVDRNSVDRNSVDRNSVDRNSVDRNSVDRNSVDRNSVDRNSVDRNTSPPIIVPQLPADMSSALDKLTKTTADAYIEVLLRFESRLPGLRDARVLASGLFGVKPPSPLLEKSCVTELQLRHSLRSLQQPQQPHSDEEAAMTNANTNTNTNTSTTTTTSKRVKSLSSYGPPGTEWCIVSKRWWDEWTRKVGANGFISGGTGAQRTGRIQAEPGEISNQEVLVPRSSHSDPPVLVPESVLGGNVEAVTPAVYSALQMWYGGGPRIVRRVIQDGDNMAYLELFPLCINLAVYSPNTNSNSTSTSANNNILPRVGSTKSLSRVGSQTSLKNTAPTPSTRTPITSNNASGHSTEAVLVSRALLVGDLSRDIAASLNVATVRLYHHRRASVSASGSSVDDSGNTSTAVPASSVQVDSIVELLPELTVSAAGLRDGALVTVEVRADDGSWPLAAQLGAAGVDLRAAGAPIGVDLGATGAPIGAPIGAAIGAANNGGRVGLDNLGNTCYLNSSLQALLHTPQLVAYFNDKAYLQDVNVANSFGYGGHLAYSFGKLVRELWSTDKKTVSPAAFHRQLGELNEQFAGNEQQDAQEVLTFLLDGLSEDLNLVPSKPYTPQPDSDGRPESELADIWWRNHLARDCSLVQALFTGQFTSACVCRVCGHASARYEPFSVLTVPLPEETRRTLTLLLLLLPQQAQQAQSSTSAWSVRVSVQKEGKVSDVVAAARELGVPGLTPHTRLIACYLSSGSSSSGGGHRIVEVVSAATPVDRLHHEGVRPHEQLALIEVQHNDNGNGGGPHHHHHQQREGTGVRDELDLDLDLDSPLASSSSSSSPTERPHEQTDGSPLQRTGVPAAVNTSVPAAVNTSVPAAVNAAVRVVIVQRHPRLQRATAATLTQNTAGGENSAGGGGVGLDGFVMDPVGYPFIEVFPGEVPISPAALYERVSARLRQYLKAPLTPSLTTTSTKTIFTLTSDNSQTNTAANNNNSASASASGEVSKVVTDALGTPLRAAEGDNDALLASAVIPQHGFLLRRVSSTGNQCSVCHWLQRCSGCVLIPQQHDNTNASASIPLVELQDGDVLAADWHFSVFEELLDTDRLALVMPWTDNNTTNTNTNTTTASACLSLESCLDKFTEEEPLSEMTCPKCTASAADVTADVTATPAPPRLVKSIRLWRLPPVLVVQIKRFQFTRHARRKLTNRVDFPTHGLDLRPYLASSRHARDDPRDTGDMCTEYDLYAAVHHVGALGGGHYVTAARELVTGSGAGHGSAAWFCYNDESVSEVSEEDVGAASAYLLFYMRRDVQSSSYQAIFDDFKRQTLYASQPPPVSGMTSTRSTNQATTGGGGDLLSIDTGIVSSPPRAIGAAIGVPVGGERRNNNLTEAEFESLMTSGSTSARGMSGRQQSARGATGSSSGRSKSTRARGKDSDCAVS